MIFKNKSFTKKQPRCRESLWDGVTSSQGRSQFLSEERNLSNPKQKRNCMERTTPKTL